MNRRTFLTTAAVGSALPLVAQNYSDYTKDPRPDVAEGTFTAGSAPGAVLAGSPVVTGPAPEAITILQPLLRHATGHLEFAVENEPYQRVDAGHAGLLPLAEHVLKFQLPPLPPGKTVRYRVTARTLGWVKVKQFYHGEPKFGAPQTSPEHRFRTLDATAATTNIAVWNDTHENGETLQALHGLTAALKPDVLLWNGDQSNDVHFERDMARQFLQPAGLAIAERWPLAYVRGNHDVRGPAAWSLPAFTGTPEDRFYYAFRSGPVAALVMDTGEDKPDETPQFGGMVAFQKMQERQAEWLDTVVQESWFREAPHKVLFCHIPLWFTRDIFPTHQRWECHDVCRRLWVPKLAEAGVKLVVSGHTHDHRWMPAKEGQPIAQLIGGGPQPRSATFIRITATREALTLKMSKLDGAVVADVTMKGT
jgi:acid phosphatase type 7